MRIPFARTASPISTPIRSQNRRGFAIGWLAIVSVAAASFAFAAYALPHANLDLDVVNGSHLESVGTPHI